MNRVSLCEKLAFLSRSREWPLTPTSDEARALVCDHQMKPDGRVFERDVWLDGRTHVVRPAAASDTSTVPRYVHVPVCTQAPRRCGSWAGAVVRQASRVSGSGCQPCGEGSRRCWGWSGDRAGWRGWLGCRGRVFGKARCHFSCTCTRALAEKHTREGEIVCSQLGPGLTSHGCDACTR